MALKPLVFEGGVDLMTPAVFARPGTLQACQNYERGVLAGYTRSGGFERIDGLAYTTNDTVGTYKFVRVTWVSALLIGGDGTVPESGAITYESDGASADVSGYIVDVESYTRYSPEDLYGSAYGSFILIVPPSANLAADGTSGEFEWAGGSPRMLTTSVAMETLSEPQGSAAAINEALEAFATTQRDAIESVPGQAGSDILGGFMLKHRPYVIRDLQRVYFGSGLYSDKNEGQYLTIGASEYEILAVTYLTGDSGFLTLDPVAGSGTDVTGISSPTVYALSGSAPDCDVSTDFNEISTGFTYTEANGTGTTWEIVDDVYAERLVLDADSPGLLGQQTNAALWKADASGWSRVELGREMAFSDGQTSLANFTRAAVLEGVTPANTGFKFPTASTLNGASTTGINSDNGVTTALSGASGDTFIALGFDFASIPSTAIIRGIEVTIERQSDTANAAKDNTVTLVGLTGPVENKAQGVWPNATTVATYGGSTDLWGNPGMTVAELQAATFGVLLVADRNVDATATVGGCDYIAIKVHYTERDTPAYIWDGTTDVAISIRHTQILGGSTTDGDAYGYLSITCAKNAAKTRLVNIGDEIRSAASGGGNLLATVAARDVPIFYPGQTDLDNNCSQYQTHVSNFYASDNFDAAYTVCGVGPVICFDGARTTRIRTHLAAGEDNPRHIARMGRKLVLGYYTGLVLRSNASDPFQFLTSEGAEQFPMGDRVMGLSMREGTQLLVPCQSSIQYIDGLDDGATQTGTITDKRGMLEYTLADMGRVLGCDGLGVFVIDTAPTLGPAERNYLSAAVAPWLQPRLQAVDNAGQYQIGPVCALGVGAKNQYRLYMEDGWFLNMTITDPPTPMFGRYLDPGQADLPLPLRCVFSGRDSRGRERIFAAFRGAKEGYVFELDAGRSFDGEEIPAYIVTNPLFTAEGAPDRIGQWGCNIVHGTGYGVATLTYSRAADYGTPDPDTSQALTLGASDADATLTPKPFRGAVDFAKEGKDLTLRFDSSTSSEGAHTLQFTNLMVDDRGYTRGYSGS
jgi:hypothetical protein